MSKRRFLLPALLILLVTGCGQQEQAVVAVADTRPPDASPAMELEGMFSYMADAALFRDCRNNKTWPVSMEGAYIEIERAYLNSGISPGSEVYVKLEGRLLERPAMEENHNIIKLIVDKPLNILPEKTCSPTVHADLIGTYWKLVEVDGGTVTMPADMKEAHMILSAAESRVHGNAGCNNFFGQFETAEDVLTFSALGSTRMACPPAAMDTERDFFAALGATTRYGISGLFLELYADDRLLARFEAVYL